MPKKASAAHHDAHRPNVKLFAMVFGALLFLTLLTVAVSKLHLQRHEAVTLGLLIAAVKSSLVAAVFMHLWGESKLIHRVLWGVGFFAVFMVVCVVIDGHTFVHQLTDPAPVAAQHPDEGH
jgi:caa(3)-type oxidase subunit IV